MPITRRKFIKISGLTGGGLVSNLPSWTQFFIDIPAAEQNFISVCGILPRPDSLREFGAHLRWTLPPARGLPELIHIYKRAADPKAPNMLIRPAESDQPQLPSSIGNLRFSGNLAAFRLSTSNQFGKAYRALPNQGNQTVKISFDQPVDMCTIQLGKIKKLTARVLYPDNTLSHEVSIEEAATYAPLFVQAKNGRPFQHVEIPVHFEFLYFIEFNGNAYVCQSKGWKLIDTLNNRKDVESKTLYKRIAPDTKNYYIDSAPIGKYSELAKRYTGLMASFLDPAETTFLKDPEYESMADIPGDKLLFKTKDASATRLSAWNILMMGSPDPNIARLLGLYYVDTSLKGEKEMYDYKVEAVYKKKSNTCGVVRNIGGSFAGLPGIDGQLAATQTKNTWWSFDPEYTPAHVGKVRLTWPNSALSPDSESWSKFIEPVIYGLSINDTPARLISPKAEQNNLVFIDQFAPVQADAIRYSVFAIDLFGQVSNRISSDIHLKDMDLPAVPGRLLFEQTGNKTYLQFEYGGFQYLADPEIHYLNVYHKLNSIYDHNLKINYHSYTVASRDENGRIIISLELTSPIGNDIPYHTVHFTEDRNGKKLPARQRKKFRISSCGDKQVICVTAFNDLPDTEGRILLEANTRDKESGWALIPEARQTFKSPVATRLIGYCHFLENTTDTAHFSNGLNPTATNSLVAWLTHVNAVRAGTQSDLFQNNDGSSIRTDYTEVYIDRTLNESDLFTDGTIQIGSTRYRILAQSAGYGNAQHENLQTKIIIDGYHDFSPQEVWLTPAIQDTPFASHIGGLMLLHFENHSGLLQKHTGEFMFRGTIGYPSIKGAARFYPVEKREEDQVHVIAQIKSDARVVGSEIQVLVQLAAKVSYLHTRQQTTKSNKALYFEPYRADVSHAIAGVSLAPREAFRNVFFTVNAVDMIGHQGELSVIAQFIKTRNKNDKPPRPGAPFPCADRAATEAFVTLPNATGRSYFKLCWEGSMDYRYEVGRALDKTILLTHKNLWLNGEVANPQGYGGTAVTGSGLSVLSTGNPSVVSVQRSIFTESVDTYLYGRMRFGTGGAVQYFEIVKIKESGSTVQISLRALLQGRQPGNMSWEILPTPDYLPMVDNIAHMQVLANESPGAFSIVTGQALRDTAEFLDEVPGAGSGYFFYKVRAVDASEIRSDWSDASVPVWQVDTRVPEAPEDFQVEVGDRVVRIIWKKIPLSRFIKEFQIFRFTELPDTVSVQSETPLVTLSTDELSPRSIIAKKGVIQLPEHLHVPIPAGLTPLPERINQVISSLTVNLHSIDNPSVNIYDPLKFSFGNDIDENELSITLKRMILTDAEIILPETALNIDINGKRWDTDGAYWMYEDRSINGGITYYYKIRSIKEFPVNNKLLGKYTSFLIIKGIDKSTPDSPIIEFFGWLNVRNENVSFNDPTANKVKISLNTTIIPFKIIFYRRIKGTELWELPTINAKIGWQEYGENNQATFFDINIINMQNLEYGIKIELDDSRISDLLILTNN